MLPNTDHSTTNRPAGRFVCHLICVFYLWLFFAKVIDSEDWIVAYSGEFSVSVGPSLRVEPLQWNKDQRTSGEVAHQG